MAVPTLTNNSPAGGISWGAFTIQYNGVGYSISAGSTTQRWVWWRWNGGGGNSLLEAGAAVPSDLTDDDIVLFGNKNGIGVRIQSATLLDGELIVDGSILTDALSANAIDGMTITGALMQSSNAASRGIKFDDTALIAYDTVGNPTFEVDASNGLVSTTGGVWTSGSITGALVQSSATASRGIKFDDTALVAYDTVGSPTFSLDASTGDVSLTGALWTGGSITGASLTGSTTVTGAMVQSSATAARGVKFDSTGLAAYDNSGTATFFLDASNGNVSTAGGVWSNGAINGATVTGGTLQTETTAARGIKINSSGFTAYDGAGVATVSITTSGVATFKGTITSGSTITGATVQSTGTASRGIKMDSTQLVGYDGSGVAKFTLNGSTGALSLAGAITAGSTIDGSTITAGTVQTESTASRGIKINSSGLTAYNGTGTATVTLTTLGVLTTTGSVQTGGSVTGATIQTTATAARGIKMDATTLTGYDATGVAKFVLNGSTGALTMAGALTTGSTIDGAIVTGGTVQTETTASRGIKINSSGLTAYDGTGVATVTITTAGVATFKGTISSGSSITGATVSGGTVTGSTLQTAAGNTSAIRLDNTSGLIAYDSTGTNVFQITPTGTMTLAGTLTSTGTITGGTITGGTIQTSASTTVSRLVIVQDAAGGVIKGYSGNADINPSTIDTQLNGSQPALTLKSGTRTGYTWPAGLGLVSSATGGNATVTISDNLQVSSSITAAAVTTTANVTVGGSMSVDYIYPKSTGAITFGPTSGTVKISGASNIGGRVGQDPATPGNGTAIVFTGAWVAATTDNMNSGTPNVNNTMPFYAKTITGFGAYVNGSDKSMKNSITAVDGEAALAVVKGVKVKSFKMNDVDPDRVQHGVVAQDLEKVLPSAVMEVGDVKAVSYQDLWAMHLATTQQLIKRIERLEARK